MPEETRSFLQNGSSLLPRLHALAASGTERLRTSSHWEAWLHRAERFSSFGWENTMLIWAQAPDAVRLATYQDWKRRGRQVLSGASAIRLIVRGKGGQEDVRMFFDLFQTEGRPVRVPQPRGALDDIGADGHVWDTLRDLVGREGFRTVVRADADTGIDWERRIISIRADGDRAADLAHQAAHVLLGSSECTGTRRVEADSLTYLIQRRFGMDTSTIVFPYVASWAGSDPRTDRTRIIAAAGNRITAAASKAFACIDASPSSSARPVSGPRRAAATSAASPSSAGRSGVPVLGERARSLIRVQEEALRYFGNQVRRSWVPAYLDKRGFGAAIRRDWSAGYAPGTWTAVTDHLRDKGFTDDIIEASGLATRSSKHTLIDVFRDRAVFPVCVPDGTVVGFIGRAAPDAGPDVPKYLNSRETDIYHKGRVLFGLHEGWDALSAGAVPVLVEGPMDAMAVTAAGSGRYVGVAPCGTAFTAEQLGELARACDLSKTGILAAFDGDPAGCKAAVKAYGLLSCVTGRPMRLALTAGQDPASVFADHGPQALRLALDHFAVPLADLVIDTRLEKYTLDGIDAQFNALGAVAPVIARMAPMEWPRQAFRVAGKIGLTPTEVTDAVIAAMRNVEDARAGPSPGRAVATAAKDSIGPPAVTTVSLLPPGTADTPAQRPSITSGQARQSALLALALRSAHALSPVL